MWADRATGSDVGRRQFSKTQFYAHIALIASFLLSYISNFVLNGSTRHTLEQLTQSSLPEFDYPSLPVRPRNETFGACLMVKGDNDLLSEWVPYHYTLLPLRYLLVVTDTGNLEDPKSVLKKWTAANTDLHWWVVNVSQFENIHGIYNSSDQERRICAKIGGAGSNCTAVDPKIIIQQVAHKHLIHKQNAMITFCTNFMKERGVRWVSLYDTDEFIAINQFRSSNDIGEGNLAKDRLVSQNSTDHAKSLENNRTGSDLTPMHSKTTVVDVINSLQNTQRAIKSCHTLMRVSFGASENFTCPGSEGVKNFARSHFDYQSFATLRYQEHAVKGDFEKNRFGKVFIDLSNISDQTLSMQPRNIHRPFKEECRRPIVEFESSPFYLMHYAGGWERFRAKDDKRREYDQWKELADVADSTTCCGEEIYRWLPRFVGQVGLGRAKFLLGAINTTHNDTTFQTKF